MPEPFTSAAAGSRLTYADPRILADSLATETGGPVEVRETHMSWVVLTGERAYKLKRPVQLDFADLRGAPARAASCRRELRLNADLAPGIGLAVRSVLPRPDGTYRLAPDGDPEAIDHVIEMRRFDESRTMRALLERQELSFEQAAAAGERLSRFHRTAARAPFPPDERARFERNADALLHLAGNTALARDVRAAMRFAGAFLTAWSEVLGARFAHGWVVDGHGDVRAEHVLFGDDDTVRIVDRLDIDALRDVDVADELAFLASDLEAHGGAGYVGAVLDGYVHGGGVVPPTALLAYFTVYRFLVRAKVALLPGAADGTADGAAAGAAEAQRLVGFARHGAWRARGPLLLLVTGPPASGKSTLAAALGRASGLPVLSSDAVRREQPALGYGAAARASIYRELARRAAREGPFIVDATFGDPDLQAAFFEAHPARADRPTLVIDCTAPSGVRIARADHRLRADGGTSSDAGPDVARDLGERFVGLPDVRVDARLAVDTTVAVADQLDAIEAWLDHRLAVGDLL